MITFPYFTHIITFSSPNTLFSKKLNVLIVLVLLGDTIQQILAFVYIARLLIHIIFSILFNHNVIGGGLMY